MRIWVLSILVLFTGEILALQSNPCPWKVFALVLCEDPPTPLVAWTVHRPSSTPNNWTNWAAGENNRNILPKQWGQRGKTRNTTEKRCLFWWKVHMGFIYCIVFLFRKPISHSLCALFFRMESMALGKVHFGGTENGTWIQKFLGRNHPKTHHPKKPDHSYANTIPSVYDTPAASKQVNLTPHDIPRILRAQKNMFFLFFCGQKKSSKTRFVSGVNLWKVLREIAFEKAQGGINGVPLQRSKLEHRSLLEKKSSPKSIPVENYGHYLMFICSIVNDLSQNLGYQKKENTKKNSIFAGIPWTYPPVTVANKGFCWY